MIEIVIKHRDFDTLLNHLCNVDHERYMRDRQEAEDEGGVFDIPPDHDPYWQRSRIRDYGRRIVFEELGFALVRKRWAEQK